MYRTDMPQIAEIALGSDAGFVATATFAILSIRQPFRTVARQMKDVAARGQESACLWGHKRAARAYLLEHATRLRETLADSEDAHVALEALCEVPGLGLAKGGFIAQMCGYNVGCLDSRNIEEFGLPARAVSFPKARLNEHARLNAIASYVRLCSNLGGAGYLWDNWCAGIAAVSLESHLSTAARVSAHHVAIVKGGL